MTGGSGRPAAAVLQARAFGGAEDLDVDFRMRRPQLVTHILELCLRDALGERWTEDALWQWTLPRRTQGLLAVARACNVASVAALARCTTPECGEQLELELELDSFARAPAEDSDSCTWRGGDAEVTLRLPTGADQRRWLDAQPADAGEPASGELASWMGTSLVREVNGAAPVEAWRLPHDWLPGIEDALAERDPTTALSVSAACAGCGGEMEIEIDLEALLLERLARVQRALLFEVHELASGYHWSEPQILALPAWRRARYLSALRGEA